MPQLLSRILSPAHVRFVGVVSYRKENLRWLSRDGGRYRSDSDLHCKRVARLEAYGREAHGKLLHPGGALNRPDGTTLIAAHQLEAAVHNHLRCVDTPKAKVRRKCALTLAVLL